MPIYEYQCSSCGELHEALQKISDAPLVDCPACGKATLRKKVSAAAFRLKGGGWYETDFKSSGKKNIAGDEGAGRSDGGDTKEAGGKTGAAGAQSSEKGGQKGGDARKDSKDTKRDAKPTTSKGDSGSSGAA